MDGIEFPLNQRMKNQKVSNLQLGLELLLRQGALLADDEGTRRDLADKLKTDRATGTYGAATRDLVMVFQRESGLEPTGAVDEATATALNARLRELGAFGEEPGGEDEGDTTQACVFGVVRYLNGKPAAGLVVGAIACGLRQRTGLGEARTDERGAYRIFYSAGQRPDGGKGGPDLAICVSDREKVLYETPMDAIVMDAPPAAEINVDLSLNDPHGEKDYARVTSSIAPLLGDIALDTLSEKDTQDIALIARKVDIAPYKVAHLVVAQKLASAHGIPAEFAYALFAENALLKLDLLDVSTARFDIGLDAELTPLFYDIVLLPEDAVVAAVAQAVEHSVVPGSLQQQVPGILEQLSPFVAEAQAYAHDQQVERLQRLVERFAASGKYEELLGILQSDSLGNFPVLFSRLQSALAFENAPAVARAEARATLGEILRYDDEIIERVAELQGIKEPHDVQRLARLNPAEWRQVLRGATSKITVGGQPLRAEVIDLQASSLARKLEQRFPTVAFAAQLERDEASLGPHHDELVRFLNDHAGFDLATSNVEVLLKGEREAPSAPFKQALKATQRVFKLAPSYKKTKALVEAGIRSASQINAMGETQFVGRFGDGVTFTKEEARSAFRKAADAHTASGLLAGELHALANASRLPALSATLAADKLVAVTQDFPNMKSLFQSIDTCECEECRTVHSPAAYLVDALEFLKHRAVMDAHGAPCPDTARDVLFARRPDLGDMDLSCANTMTPVPYIDIVNELLEEAVSPDLGLTFVGPVAQGAISLDLLGTLQAAALPYTDKAFVTGPDAAGNYVVRDAKIAHKISATFGGWLVRRMRQTYGKAPELAAAPEYVNAVAYDVLKASERAFALPFDLWHQETRSYFAQFGVLRADLMRALYVPTDPPPDPPYEAVIAAEALGLSDKERELIVTAAPAKQPIYWNTPTTPASNTLNVVDTFLTKARLEYSELQDLLALAWINPVDPTDPTAEMFVMHLDDTCDLGAKVIVNLNDEALDRFHRFIRLWRATGWSAAALDRAIRAPNPGNELLDDACLIRVQELMQLQAKLGLSADELCSLFDVIPTDGEDSRYAQLFLNPAANGIVNPDFLPQNVEQNELNAAQGVTSPPIVKLLDCSGYLALCLGAARSDIDLLAASLADPYETDLELKKAILSARNIASVYSLNLLARAPKLSVAELLILKSLTGIDVLASPASALSFLEKVATVRASGVSPADLQYLLTHTAEDLEDRVLSDAAITDFLTSLRAAYLAAAADNQSPYDDELSADENKAGVKALLKRLPTFSDSDVAGVEDILGGTWLDPIPVPNPVPTLVAEFIDKKLHDELEPWGVDTGPVKAAQDLLASDSHAYDAARTAVGDAETQATTIATSLVGAKEALDPAVLVADVDAARSCVTLAINAVTAASTDLANAKAAFDTHRAAYDAAKEAAQQAALDADLALGEANSALAAAGTAAGATATAVDAARVHAEETTSDLETASANLCSVAASFASYSKEYAVAKGEVDTAKVELAAAKESLATTVSVAAAARKAVEAASARVKAARASRDRAAAELAITDTALANNSALFMIVEGAVEDAQPHVDPVATELNAAKAALDAAPGPDIDAARTHIDAATAFLKTAGEYLKAATTALENGVAVLEADRKTLMRSVAGGLAAYFCAEQMRALLHTAVVAALKLDANTASSLLECASLPAVNKTLLDVLTDAAFAASSGAITSAGFDDEYRAVRLLQKMGQFLAAHKLTAEQARWMLLHNGELGWLQLDRLPYQDSCAPASFTDWEQLQAVLGLIETYAPVNNPADAQRPFTVFGLFELVLAGLEDVDQGSTSQDVAVSEVLTYASRLCGWDVDLVGDLDERYFPQRNLAAYVEPATLLRLGKAAALLRRLGLDVAEAVIEIHSSLALDAAKIMRQALKARYEESEWLGVLKNVQDRLRVQKRDALVAHILAESPTPLSIDDLFDWFLIDVEMSACQPTSRIVQAHGTVQLFVQRCLMGLEPTCVADTEMDRGWEQWDKWMANFRVWEANRKVFLYPENWIEPELRDDKSEIFVALENALQQDELTDQAVEDAAVGYLEKLDQVAALDVMATYYQADTLTTHVFARTKGGDPATYYYRQLIEEREWTPWEKVDVNITGEHLLAFDRNRRLALAWPVFTEEADQSQEPPPVEGSKPAKRWKIQLAVSERVGKRWTPKRVSKDGLYWPARYKEDRYTKDALPKEAAFGFFVWNAEDAGQAISCFVPWPEHADSTSKYVGSFALTGCAGYPEPNDESANSSPCFFLPRFQRAALMGERFTEMWRWETDSLAVQTILNPAMQPIINNTPGTFRVTYPMQMSMVDWFCFGLQSLLGGVGHPGGGNVPRYRQLPLGTLMPYFYGDRSRGYVITPTYKGRRVLDGVQGAGTAASAPVVVQVENTFSDVLRFVQAVVALGERYIQQYREDPKHAAEWLVTNPEYIRLVEEYVVYRRLRLGATFRNFYHPLVCFLRATLNRGGIPALMRRDTQLHDTGFEFPAVYQPTPFVHLSYPRENLAFDRADAYADYNWELFFHLPFEIFARLNADQRFSQARLWAHYVFNPVGIESATSGGSPMSKYWITKPFFELTGPQYVEQRIDQILYTVADDPDGQQISDLRFAISQWRAKPFAPHVIARSRPVAYMQAVVMKYIQNLIDWGDSLFRQSTMESVNQATQMYILADKLLGPKPRIVPPAVPVPPKTYHELEAEIDLFGNALLDLENLVPDLGQLPHEGHEFDSPTTFNLLYFCIPPNENMLQYWDLVADRLFKIRNCQTIDGVERVLALFSPPIDPGALVRAAAAGLDISSFLAGLAAPLPNYRFSVMTQKATELAQLVSSLGNALLQALEKRDAEKLSRLRSEQEITVLSATRSVKEAAIAEAEAAVDGLAKSRLVTEERRKYYAEQEYMNDWETAAVVLAGVALQGDIRAGSASALASILSVLPEFTIGASGVSATPVATATKGGVSLGKVAECFASTLSTIARLSDRAGAMAGTQGSYRRRKDDWDFQVRLADRELVQIDQQMLAANLRVDMLKKDLVAHDTQIANAEETDAYLRSKYTNQELYQWMVGQVSSVYFKAYQLAFDVARRAERCFSHELGSSSTFLSAGYWDSLRNGLMAADGLLYDIKRMEVAYLEENKREYELTKHVSLAQLDPLSLLQLKNTGKCIVQIPEAAFDLDHPGHYMRRLKSVSLSIPCVVGPYTGVNCRLSLVSNRYRKSTTLAGSLPKYVEKPLLGDGRFVYNVGTIQSIATSTGQSDSGVFELNLRDDRYVPFEGTGAIGTWQIELPTGFPQFDYDTISDIVLHLRYTARDGGSAFRKTVEEAMKDVLDAMILAANRSGLYQAYSLRQQFPNEWRQLQQAGTTQLTLESQHFPFFAQGHSPTIAKVIWCAPAPAGCTDPQLVLPGIPTLSRDPNMPQLFVGTSDRSYFGALGTPFPLTSINPVVVEDLIIVVQYTIS